MDNKRMLSLLAVAVMVMSTCACLLGGGADAAGDETVVVNDAAPIKIDSDGKVSSGDYEKWGATYSYDATNGASLVFEGKHDVRCNGSEYYIMSAVKLTITIKDSLKISSCYSEDITNFSCINTTTASVGIYGPGALELVVPEVSMLGIGFNNSSNNKNTITGCDLTITVNSAQMAEGIHSQGDCEITASSVKLRNKENIEYSILRGLSNLSSGKMTMIDSRIDISFDAANNCFGIATQGPVSFKNCIVDIKVGADGANGNITAISTQGTTEFVNTDAEITALGKTSFGMYNATVDNSNIEISCGTSSHNIIYNSFTIKSTWAKSDYELRNASGIVSETDFSNLTGYGLVYNKKITVGFGTEDTNDSPAPITGMHGSTIKLPRSSATKDGEVVVGWTDGFDTYKVGSDYTIRINIELKPIYGHEEAKDNTPSTVVVACMAIFPIVLVAGIIVWDLRFRK